MKTIVIAGAASGVGKSTLARAVVTLIPGAQWVKLGHHPSGGHDLSGPERDETSSLAGVEMPRFRDPPSPKISLPLKCGAYYQKGTPFAAVLRNHPGANFLIIESNSVLEELSPDLLVYLDGPQRKPSALRALASAHIRSGERIVPEILLDRASALGIPIEALRKIAWLAGARPEPVGALIMAGGKSSRMGRSKARLEIGNEMMVERIHRQLRNQFDYLSVCVGVAGECILPGVDHVADEVPNLGPLEGLRRGLASSPCGTNFVVACDIPNVHPLLIRTLLSESDSHEIVVPSFAPGKVEPLCAVYSKSVSEKARHLLGRDIRSVKALFALCGTYIAEMAEGDWYFNINTPADLARFRRMETEGPNAA